jgi:Peptidase U49
MNDTGKSADELKLEQLWATVSTPLNPLLGALHKAVFTIAPEREDELAALIKTNQISGEVETNEHGLVGESSVLIRRIWVGLPSMEEVWAFSYGAAYVWNELQKTSFKGSLSLTQTPEANAARELLTWAILRRIGEANPWPPELPQPDGSNAEPKNIELASQIFYSIVAFLELHEFAHIILNHRSDFETPSDERIRAEFEADEWAYDWILDQWRSIQNDEAVYIKRSVMVAAALATVACLELYSDPVVSKITHPNPIDRLLRYLIKHANEITELPWIHAWLFSSSVIHLHLARLDSYDAANQRESARHFFNEVRPYFNKSIGTVDN